MEKLVIHAGPVVTTDDVGDSMWASRRQLHLLLTCLLTMSAAFCAFRDLPRSIDSLSLKTVFSSLTAAVLLGVLGKTLLSGTLSVGWIGLATVAWAVNCVVRFPQIANHHFLLLWALIFILVRGGLATMRPNVTLMFLGKLAALVLCASGLQKLAHGTYSKGQMLSYLAQTDARFNLAFSSIPFGEPLRILSPTQVGTAVFRFESAPLIVLANLVVALEIFVGLALLLLPRATLQKCWPVPMLGFVMALGIQVFAREISFAIILCALLSVFLKHSWTRATLVAAFVFAIGNTVAVLWFPSWHSLVKLL